MLRVCFFFFFKQKTAYEMRISDWSSDVCSSDLIAEDTIANFEAETGIKVTYDVFDSNEVLEAKLMAGGTGYDIVVPSLSFLARQIKAGVFQPLAKSKLTNYGNLDPDMMARITKSAPDTTPTVPYLWGTPGIRHTHPPA